MILRRSLILVLFLSLLVPLTVPPASAQELDPILVYTGNDSYNSGYTLFGQATGRTVEEHEVLPTDLSGYGCIVLPSNATAFSQDQLDQFTAYVQAGGRLFALGEWDGLPVNQDANANLTTLASELGSGLAIVNGRTEGALTETTNIEPSDFTTGVSSIKYLNTSSLTVTGEGQTLVRTTGENGVPFIGAERIGAGLFVLAGDTNIFSDYETNAYEGSDNDQLAFNLCSEPLPLDPVLVYTGNDALNLGHSKFGQAAGRPVDEQATLPADLSGYGCVILPLNAVAFSTEQLQQFTAYVNAGGRLFALGDNEGFSASANPNMNAVASALGSGLAIINGHFSAAITTNIEPSSFTTGVSSIGYVSAGQLAMTGQGQTLVRTQGVEGVPFIGAELIGDGLFVLSADINAFADDDGDAYANADNGQLVFNLCNGEINQLPSVTVDGVTEGASYEFGDVPAATCLVEDSEDGPSSFAATLSEITGPQAALGLGSQTASCSYTDAGDETASAQVTYSIVDTTAPVLDLPDLVVPATEPAGATVTWVATAEDAVEGTITAECTPPSGGFFSIPDPLSDSTTTVACSATDSNDNTSNDSFTVTVLGAPSQLDLLREEVQESEIHAYAIRSLDRALASAEMGLERNRLSTTCFQLNYFETQVNLYGWMGQIPSEQASEWIADAARIKAVLGC